MKKYLALILVFVVALCATACGSTDIAGSDNVTTTVVSVQASTTTTVSDGENVTTGESTTTTTEGTVAITEGTTTTTQKVTTTKPSTTKKPTTTTTTTKPTTKPTVAPNLVKPVDGAIDVNSLGYVGKNLEAYGDVDEKLANELNTLLKKYSNNISIACWRVDGSRAVLYNTQQGFFSACTVKMPVMYGYCKEMDAGNINPNTTLTYESRHYYTGSGDIRYKPYGTKFTVKTLVEKSLSISDNVAYIMLLEKYGKELHNQNMKKLGCDSVAFSNGSKWAKEIKARDLMVVWSEIYKYFCSDSPNAKMLKDSCTNTKYNYGTKRVTEYDYSHKSGDNFGEFRAYNDAGIVWAEVPYVYVVLTRSEGTQYDRNTVDPAMEIVKKIMTK